MPVSARHGGALLLAAGFSRRFGSDKRQHLLPDGTPLLLATLQKYEMFDNLVVVIRDPNDAVAGWLANRSPPVRVIVAEDAHLGMGHSLAAGVAAVTDWSYALIGLADMPFVLPQTLLQLKAEMDAMTSPAIIVPTYANKRGHPVGFDATFFAELKTLQGDAGAREVLQRSASEVIEVAVEDPGIIKDVDLPDDG